MSRGWGEVRERHVKRILVDENEPAEGAFELAVDMPDCVGVEQPAGVMNPVEWVHTVLIEVLRRCKLDVWKEKTRTYTFGLNEGPQKNGLVRPSIAFDGDCGPLDVQECDEEGAAVHEIVADKPRHKSAQSVATAGEDVPPERVKLGVPDKPGHPKRATRVPRAGHRPLDGVEDTI